MDFSQTRGNLRNHEGHRAKKENQQEWELLHTESSFAQTGQTATDGKWEKGRALTNDTWLPDDPMGFRVGTAPESLPSSCLELPSSLLTFHWADQPWPSALHRDPQITQGCVLPALPALYPSVELSAVWCCCSAHFTFQGPCPPPGFPCNLGWKELEILFPGLTHGLRCASAGYCERIWSDGCSCTWCMLCHFVKWGRVGLSFKHQCLGHPFL